MAKQYTVDNICCTTAYIHILNIPLSIVTPPYNHSFHSKIQCDLHLPKLYDSSGADLLTMAASSVSLSLPRSMSLSLAHASRPLRYGSLKPSLELSGEYLWQYMMALLGVGGGRGQGGRGTGWGGGGGFNTKIGGEVGGFNSSF